MKLHSTIYFIFALGILTGCGNNKQAGKIYAEAEKSSVKKEYNKAKILIDSILNNYPNNIEYTTRSKELLRVITKAEQENNLVFLDSMLSVKQEELSPLLANFEENLEVGDIPLLIHKRQKVENSALRSYIMANLNKNGAFYLSSRYVGKQRSHHTAIKVYDQSLSAETESIEEDSLLNRSFTDDEWHWEIINYKENRDNGVADFISNHFDKPLKVEFIGRQKQYIIMEKYDKEAIRDAYEISFLLRETAKIKEQIENVKSTLNRIK